MADPGKNYSYKQAQLAEEWDAIVIGSGIGGLTAAALLSVMAGSVFWCWSASTLRAAFRIRFIAPVMSGMWDCITSDRCRMSDSQCAERSTTSPMGLFYGVPYLKCTIALSSMVAVSISPRD